MYLTDKHSDKNNLQFFVNNAGKAMIFLTG